MPTKQKTESRPDLAVQEVIDPKNIVAVAFGEQTYTFKRARLNAMQFRSLMQEGKDAVAVKWLIGDAQWDRFLTANSDEDGCTSVESYSEFINAIGQEVGTGNS